MGVVERVDEDDEALGFVAPLEGEARDILDDHGVEPLGDRQVIRSAKGPGAKVAEPETRDAARRLGNLDRVAL